MFKGEIREISDVSCSISVLSQIRTNGTRQNIQLCCCLPKGKKLDLIIRQATEAGISQIIPLYSDHSLIKYDKESDVRKKMDRWEKIIREALQQSGSPVLTKISAPIPVASLPVLDTSRERGFFCHQEKLQRNSLNDLISGTPDTVRIIIGPEGGLSEKEVQLLSDRGYSPLYLGDNVLRTETACLFATAAVITLLELL